MQNNFHKKAYALRRKEAEKSLHAFTLTYLSNHLDFPPSKAHLEIFDELTSMLHERGRKFAIAAPSRSMDLTSNEPLDVIVLGEYSMAGNPLTASSPNDFGIR